LKTLRIVLQVVIGFAGLVALAVLTLGPTKVDLTAIIILVGAVAFLFALTLMLRGETEKRLTGRRPDTTSLVVVMLLLGGFGVFAGIGYFMGTEALPDGKGGCRWHCQLIVATASAYGEHAARMLAGTLYSAAGLLLIAGGALVIRISRR